MNFLFKYLTDKWSRGHSPLLLVCGETGSGKSYTTLKLCHEIKKKFPEITFDLKKSLFVNLDDFILSFLGSEKTIYIIDEGKKHLDSRSWWSKFNKYFGDIVATQRYKNNIYIVILPLAKKLAKEHRDMIDAIIEMKKPGYAVTYAIDRRWSEIRKFELWKYWLGNMKIGLPPKKLVEEYKELEKVNKEGIMLEIAGNVLPKRRCDSCGYMIDFVKQKCKKCGRYWNQEDLYTLIKKKVKSKRKC